MIPLPFSLWLISLNIMPSKFIHVVTNDRISFFFHCVLIPHSLYPFIYPLTLLCFHTLAIMLFSYQLTWEYRQLFKIMILFSLDMYPEEGLMEYGGSSFHFLRKLHIGFHCYHTPLHSHQECANVPFLCILMSTCCLLSFWCETYYN